MDKKEDLRSILIEYHFDKLFQEMDLKEEAQKTHIRNRMQKTIEKDVEQMLEEELQELIKKEKKKPKNWAIKALWTVLQITGSVALAYSVNAENWFFIISFSIVMFVATIWAWFIDN